MMDLDFHLLVYSMIPEELLLSGLDLRVPHILMVEKDLPVEVVHIYHVFVQEDKLANTHACKTEGN